MFIYHITVSNSERGLIDLALRLARENWPDLSEDYVELLKHINSAKPHLLTSETEGGLPRQIKKHGKKSDTEN